LFWFPNPEANTKEKNKKNNHSLFWGVLYKKTAFRCPNGGFKVKGE